MTTGPVVEGQPGCLLDDVSVTYPGAHARALDRVSLPVAPGEVLAIVGPSGSGKSTLLRVTCGLQPADTGRVIISGIDSTDIPPERRPVAMLFQGFALFPHLTVADNIGFGLRIRKVARADRETRVRDAAESLGLTSMLGRLPRQLSGGERQRVALARALVRDPAVFCLDEPLSSLDPPLRYAARRDLDRVLRVADRCALYVTHDQVEAMTIGDQVAVLREGRVEQVGSPRTLYDNPETAFVAGFLGSPPMSLIEAASGILPVPTVNGVVTTLGIRPERVRLEPGGAGLVTEVDDLGHERLVTVELARQVLVARGSSHDRHRVGERVTVSAAATDVLAFDAGGARLR